jgi:four helix bundle protein
MFDHEKLDVYQLLLRFITWSTDLMAQIRETAGPDTRETRDQLDRACLSAVLNTAEGNAKRTKPLKRKFFDDARGSAMECAACLDALVAKRACTAERVLEGKQMLFRSVQMLTRLVQLNDDGQVVREDASEYSVQGNASEEL